MLSRSSISIVVASLIVVAASRVLAQSEPTPAVTPPEVLTRVDVVLPPDALTPGQRVTVVLTITIDREGAVTGAVVTQSAGALIDDAAMTAVRQWRFKPAIQNDQPVASRINVPFTFTSPANDVGAPLAAPPPLARPEPATGDQETPIEVTVQGERELRSVDRAASDFHLQREVLQAAPRAEGVDVLRSVPGLYIGREEGAAVAHSYMLRGFDAEHGQDIEIRVGGLPINQPSHIHGQGYADLGFLIGDVVQELHVSEGVYDPRQGDFAVAGSIHVDLGVDDTARGAQMKLGLGAFGSRRVQLRWAPLHGERETFGAAQISQTDGFGENRAGDSVSALMQTRFGEGAWRYRALAIAYAARAALAGMVRTDDVAAGRVCFTCVYPLPTARGQNASAQRMMLGFFAEHRNGDAENGELGVWLGYDHDRQLGNHSGFLDSGSDPGNETRGDLSEQLNRTLSLGVDGRYRIAASNEDHSVERGLELGASARIDDIAQSQNMVDASNHNQTWERVQDAGINGFQAALWLDLEWKLKRILNLRAGARAALLGYDVNDRLALDTTVSDVPGVHASAMGRTLGPRASAELLATRWLSLRAAYGEGYRSGQASLVHADGSVPFTKVRSADLGARVDAGDVMALTLGGFYTGVSSDLIFDAHENKLEAIGPTRRLGVALTALSRPWSWLLGSMSLTWAHATLVDGADGIVAGSRVPNAPPWVFRADVGARHFLVKLMRSDLDGRVGLGLTALSARPLSGGGTTPAFATLDVSTGLSWGAIDLSLEIYNLFDARYAALASRMESRWDPAAPPSTATHIAAASPRAWNLTLGMSLP